MTCQLCGRFEAVAPDPTSVLEVPLQVCDVCWKEIVEEEMDK